MNEDAARALQIAGGLIGVALLLRHSILGVLCALAAAVPSAYAVWIGAQQEGQKTYTYAMLLFLGSVLLAAILFVLWLI